TTLDKVRLASAFAPFIPPLFGSNRRLVRFNMPLTGGRSCFGRMTMRKTLIMMALLLPIAACSQTEQGAAIGGLGGAAIGSAVARDPVQGAILGGAIGAVGGA